MKWKLGRAANKSNWRIPTGILSSYSNLPTRFVLKEFSLRNLASTALLLRLAARLRLEGHCLTVRRGPDLERSIEGWEFRRNRHCSRSGFHRGQAESAQGWLAPMLC